MKVTDAKTLKPAEGEISQIQTILQTGKYAGKIGMWSIYLSNNVYHLVKGYIFHVRQNHEVFALNGNYESLVKLMNKQ